MGRIHNLMGHLEEVNEFQEMNCKELGNFLKGDVEI